MENQQPLPEERLLAFMEAPTENVSQFKIIARIGGQEMALQKADLVSLLNDAGCCQRPLQTGLPQPSA